jgi:hypothetical protein
VPTRRLAFVLAAAAALAVGGCDEYGGGPKTATRSGYRAVLAYATADRYEVAVRGEKQRVAGKVGGSELVRVLRPDLGKIWQYRPATKKLFEAPWAGPEELVPGYPLEPRFDPAAYADRFGGKMRRLDDALHGMHPCERYEMTTAAGDRAVLWVARDLERLVVRIVHARRDASGAEQPVSDTQLLDVRLGAPAKLFEKPAGFAAVTREEDLAK